MDFSLPLIVEKTERLFKHINIDVEKAKVAYEYVRDEIPHSFAGNQPMRELFHKLF